MAAIVQKQWNPTRLNASIRTATLASFKAAQADAKVRRHNKSKSDVGLKIISDVQADLIPRGLQGLFEQGGKNSYEINPSGVTGIRRSRKSVGGVKTTTFGVKAGTGDKFALKFVGGDGGFAAHVIRPPMHAFPAMGPAGQDWARTGYQQIAKRTLAAQGFR
jgi:hypothetical protein